MSIELFEKVMVAFGLVMCVVMLGVIYYITQDAWDVAIIACVALIVGIAPPFIAEAIKKWQRGRE